MKQPRFLFLSATGLVLAAGFFASGPGIQQARAQYSPDPENGEAVYEHWCSHCHDPGNDMPGTLSLRVKYGEDVPAVLLEREDLTADAIKTFVRQGIQSMPPFRKTEITAEELDDLAEFMTR